VSSPWADGSASGVGSLPGEDVREAVHLVLGELPDLPHLPELPARGPGADLTGRGVALLVDLHADVQPSGWRIADAAGRDERRARGFLGQDLDALEELAEGYAGPLKIQVVGPWTLAATLELTHGDKALADPGACRDIAASLAEGLSAHVADVRRRVPGALLVVQLDEPALPGVLAGTVPTASGFGRLRTVEPTTAEDLLRTVLRSLDDDVLGAVHCCARDIPVALIQRAGARIVSLDLHLATDQPRAERDAFEDALGTAHEAGLELFAGVVPTRAAEAGLSDPAATVDPVRTLWRRLGLDPQGLARVVVTPTCGLAGVPYPAVPGLLALARAGARVLVDDPEGGLR
jgi:Cobalamin-independent synthase, Catalytic domain